MAIAAFDIDMHRIHGYADPGGRICYNAPEWPWDEIRTFERVLIEVGSAVDTSRGLAKDQRAQAYNRRRWGLYSAFELGRLSLWAGLNDMTDRILVSTAPEWTRGYPESAREAMAGCVSEDNHDIRACRCMLYFYNLDPKRWYPIATWSESV
jgi:hypothetical protein